MPTKTALVDKGSVARTKATTGAESGAGACKRFYVGRYDGYQYRSYMLFDEMTKTNAWWDDVGSITSAVLTLIVDDGFGILVDTMPSGTPKAVLQRLTDSFSEKDNHASWNSADYTYAAGTPDRSKTFYPTRAALETVNIDVTEFVRDCAPTKAGGRGKPNYGLLLKGSTDPRQNWAVFSEDATESSYRPLLTLTYEYGPTAPDAPSANLAPSGAVATFAGFEGDFTDNDTRDTLARSQVQVYAPSTIKSGTATASSDAINVTAHAYPDGTKVWFTSLTGGAGLSLAQPYYVRTVINANSFKVSATPGGTVVNITTNASALSVGAPVYDSPPTDEGAAAIQAAHFSHIPSDLTLDRNVNYQWRARLYDNEGSVSLWSDLTTFSVDNAAPNAPTLTSPRSGQSFVTLADATFSGDFTDDDAADTLLAYEVQLSAYAAGADWLNNNNILWNTGKVYVTDGGSTFSTLYGGSSLSAGVYHWRARTYDNHHTVSAWSYRTLTVTDDFVVEPNDSVNAIQLRPRAPWRIVIKAMGANRGPGTTVAVIEDAKNVGASLMYNSPGEAHWTLGPDHPQISVIEPKQTHYAIEFRHGDGWREVYAGLVWNIDASDKDIIFYGIDYLALLDRVVDTRYDPAQTEKDYANGGSKYTDDTIKTIITDQLKEAQRKANSPVGFITASAANYDNMNEIVSVYSTYQPVLNFVTGLLESHRAGKAINTRISCQKTTTGYKWVVQDNPGQLRNNIRLRYGELVQGYRMMPFGDDWATRVLAMGRDKDGLKVRYTMQPPQAEAVALEATYGRFDFPTFIDGISDGNDLERRARQMATAVRMLGRKMGLGIRSGFLQPRDGYDLMDRVPVEIIDGAIDTSTFGHDGEWVIVGITWQALQRGDSNTTLTLLPKESGSAPSGDLLVSSEISTQAEWQVGWTSPNPLNVTARHWLDQSTGTVYRRSDGTIIKTGITGT